MVVCGFHTGVSRERSGLVVDPLSWKRQGRGRNRRGEGSLQGRTVGFGGMGANIASLATVSGQPRSSVSSVGRGIYGEGDGEGMGKGWRMGKRAERLKVCIQAMQTDRRTDDRQTDRRYRRQTDRQTVQTVHAALYICKGAKRRRPGESQGGTAVVTSGRMYLP